MAPRIGLAAAIHDDLRAMAHRHLAKDFGPQRQQYDSAGHVFAIASRLMMRLLLDYHRERKALKRGDGAVHVTLDPEHQDSPESVCGADVEALNEVLERLAALDQRKADVVKYRVLWGLTAEEAADAMGVGRATVERDWSFARAWLAKELSAQA